MKDEYRNRIVLLDDERITIGAFLQSLGYDINDYQDEHLEEAYQAYIKIKKNIKAFEAGYNLV